MRKLAKVVLVITALSLPVAALPAYGDSLAPQKQDSTHVEENPRAVDTGIPVPASVEDESVEEDAVEVSTGTPVTQSGSTATDTAGESDAASDVAYGCKTKTSTHLGPYFVEYKICTMYRPRGGSLGGYMRAKARMTFWYSGPTGNSPAYGNIRWDVKWGGNMYRRVYDISSEPDRVVGYTANRPDAIQVHTSVAYSQWGCGVGLRRYVQSKMNNHYVRMPQGSLFGPFDAFSNLAALACL